MGSFPAVQPVPDAPVRRPVDLVRRRGWARISAVVACLFGTAVFGLSVAGLVLLGFVAVARFWSFWGDTDFADVPIWRWAPGGAAVIAAAIVVLSLLGAFLFYWRGAGRQVLHEIHAQPADPVRHRQFINIAEGLAIGMGRQAPSVWVVPEDVPNALSVRTSNDRILIVTEGCNKLPRDEIEAICAHEVGHLWADDAHWVTSGMVVLARARKLSGWITIVGLGVVMMVAGLAWESEFELVLWSTGLMGLAAAILGVVSHYPLRRFEVSVRRNADRIADVVAVTVAKNPESLGKVCARLGQDAGRVRHVGWRSELLWFEAIEGASSVAPARHFLVKSTKNSADAEAELSAMASDMDRRSADELRRRARAAYAAAGVAGPSR